MTRRNTARDFDIFIRRQWGESKKTLAEQYKLSVSRVESVIADRKQVLIGRYGRCIRCGHSGSMHHDAEWNYGTGPCAEYRCECVAMDAGHD